MSVSGAVNAWSSNPQQVWERLKEQVGVEAESNAVSQTIIRELSEYLNPLQKVMQEQSVLRKWEFYAYVTMLAKVSPEFSTDLCVRGCAAAVFGDDERDEAQLLEDALSDTNSFAKDVRIWNDVNQQNWFDPSMENATLTLLKVCANKSKIKPPLSEEQTKACRAIFAKAKTLLEPLRSIFECPVFIQDEFYRVTFTVLKKLNDDVTKAKVIHLYFAVKGRSDSKSNASSVKSTPHPTPLKGDEPESPSPATPRTAIGVPARLEFTSPAPDAVVPPVPTVVAPKQESPRTVVSPTSAATGADEGEHWLFTTITLPPPPLPKESHNPTEQRSALALGTTVPPDAPVSVVSQDPPPVEPPMPTDATPLLPIGGSKGPKKKEDDCCVLV